MATDFQLAGRMVTLGRARLEPLRCSRWSSTMTAGWLRQDAPPPRCRDGMTWAAILALGGRIDEGGGKRRLELAVKDEVAFWTRLEERDGEAE